MIYESISFPVEEETLVGSAVLATAGSSPQILFLHGAGKSNKERALPLAERLASEHGISSFLFDFSGHGQSSGSLQTSSLEKRVREATDAVRAGRLQPNFSVCAFSMGAHVALSIIDTHQVSSLNLFYPAVYPTGAQSLQFGPEFSASIRREGAWRNSRRFDSLGRFEGALLVAVGDQDEIIPPDLPQKLVEAAPKARSRELVMISRGTHTLLPDIYASEELFKQITNKVVVNVSYAGSRRK